MASLLDLARSTLSMALGPQLPALPFSVGPPMLDQPLLAFWALHSGARKDDLSPVTVFVFDAVRNRDKLPLAQNALKRAKTIRHPDLLRFIDGCETDTQIIIGTEFALPIAAQLRSARDDALVALGLFKVASALKFLTQDCAMIHGNVCLASVFATQAGEWKLGALDLLCSLSEESPVLLRYADSISRSVLFVPPEIAKASFAALRSVPGHAFDAWGFAGLVNQIYNGPDARIDETSPPAAIPQKLHLIFQKLHHQNPKMRPTFEKLLASGASPDGFFDSAFIKSSLFLEQFALKDEHEKDAYFNSLNASVASFPIDFCKYKILPEVIKALDFGGGGAKALGPILKIGSRLEEADFTTLIVPIITRLFSSPDRAIRVTLCDNLASYIDRLTTKIASGFSDTSAIVRESTLKSILVIIPKLTERIINNDLLRHLARLQADPEPGIRTNTTICLGKMAPHLSDAIKKKILAMAFIRSLNDGFPPARKAGLMALAATIDSYDPAEIVQKIIPSMSPLLLDTEKSIRTHTLKNMSLFLKRIEQHAETMPETAAVPKANGTADSAAGAASAAAPASASGASDSWAGWAISAVSSRIVTSVAGRDSPAGSTASPASAPASASVPQLPAPAQGLTAASTRASVQSSSPSRTSTGSPQPGVSSSVGQSSFGQSSFGQSSFGQSTARPASPLSLGRATAPLTLKPSVPALSTDSWDDDWGADLGPAPAAVASKPPIASKPPPAAAASGGESAGWDSWTDDWSAPAAQGSSAAPAAGSAWGATAMPAAAGARPMTPEQREEERQKRREAIAAQREARKAGRLGAKKT